MISTKRKRKRYNILKKIKKYITIILMLFDIAFFQTTNENLIRLGT